jgi:hypothetical protein
MLVTVQPTSLSPWGKIKDSLLITIPQAAARLLICSIKPVGWYIYFFRFIFREGIMNSTAMRNSTFISRSSQYLPAFRFIALLIAVLFALREEPDTTLVALLYLIPPGLITAYWGLGPGITSALVTFLIFNYFFYQSLLHPLNPSPNRRGDACHIFDCGDSDQPVGWTHVTPGLGT